MSQLSALRGYLEDLLADRRSRRRRVDPADDDALRAAIDLRAAKSGADLPSPEFMEKLRLRLADHHREPEPAPPDTGRPVTTRRRVVIGTSVAAAAAAGAVVDHTLTASGRPGKDTAQESNSSSVLLPVHGDWRQIATVSEVPDGATRPFDVGGVAGFLHRTDGELIAVSGVCTHQGCRLWMDAAADQLRCPCHMTSFTPTGEVLVHQLPISPAPLPRLRVRQTDRAIEVFTPT